MGCLMCKSSCKICVHITISFVASIRFHDDTFVLYPFKISSNSFFYFFVRLSWTWIELCAMMHWKRYFRSCWRCQKHHHPNDTRRILFLWPVWIVTVFNKIQIEGVSCNFTFPSSSDSSFRFLFISTGWLILMGLSLNHRRMLQWLYHVVKINRGRFYLIWILPCEGPFWAFRTN